MKEKWKYFVAVNVLTVVCCAHGYSLFSPKIASSLEPNSISSVQSIDDRNEKISLYGVSKSVNDLKIAVKSLSHNLGQVDAKNVLGFPEDIKILEPILIRRKRQIERFRETNCTVLQDQLSKGEKLKEQAQFLTNYMATNLSSNVDSQGNMIINENISRNISKITQVAKTVGFQLDTILTNIRTQIMVNGCNLLASNGPVNEIICPDCPFGSLQCLIFLPLPGSSKGICLPGKTYVSCNGFFDAGIDAGDAGVVTKCCCQ